LQIADVHEIIMASHNHHTGKESEKGRDGVSDVAQQPYLATPIAAARDELNHIADDAKAHDLAPPAAATVVEARRILDALEPVSPLNLVFSVTAEAQGAVAIRAGGPSGSLEIVAAGAGSAVCSLHSEGETRQVRYAASADIPDALVREGLAMIAAEDIPWGGDDIFDMANLTEARTGVRGIIWVSTWIAQHGPRVKYYERRGGYDQPFFAASIAEEPAVVANSLPDRVLKRMAPSVIAWVRLNREALLEFWNEGVTWTKEEVDARLDALARLP
jgi:hypothetical protein